jgi:hypothetical protein
VRPYSEASAAEENESKKSAGDENLTSGPTKDNKHVEIVLHNYGNILLSFEILDEYQKSNDITLKPYVFGKCIRSFLP